MIVMGTALAVAPFNHVVRLVDCPQVLINLENTKAHGFDFEDQEKKPHRLFWQGKCDEVIVEIAKHCGWNDDLQERFQKACDANKSATAVDDLADKLGDLALDMKKDEAPAAPKEE